MYLEVQEFGEPLSRIILPISDADANALDLGFETSLISRGVEVIFAHGRVVLGKSKVYPLEEFVEV